jgi:hypothetical protein
MTNPTYSATLWPGLFGALSCALCACLSLLRWYMYACLYAASMGHYTYGMWYLVPGTELSRPSAARLLPHKDAAGLN